jgi:hypothetical protein
MARSHYSKLCHSKASDENYSAVKRVLNVKNSL